MLSMKLPFSTFAVSLGNGGIIPLTHQLMEILWKDPFKNYYRLFEPISWLIILQIAILHETSDLTRKAEKIWGCSTEERPLCECA